MSACPHGMPTPGSCITCMDEGPVATPTKWEKVGTPFTARYDGDCSGCVRIVEAGQLAQRWDFGTDLTLYTHPHCRPVR